MVHNAHKTDLVALDSTQVTPHSDHDLEIDKTQYEPSTEAQHGVRNVEAVTLTWTRKALIAAFVSMWALYCTNAFQNGINGALSPYQVSSWEDHSLLTVIYIVSNSMAAAVYIPVAKMLDVWGRAEGFAVLAALSVLGLILSASATGLSTFCAANVFYTIGFSGMIYSVDVITADASTLKNRAFAYAFTSSPYMISAFTTPLAADSLYNRIGWRWGFGIFCIVLPFVAAPLFIILRRNLAKAKKHGMVVEESSSKKVSQSVVYYIHEFDAAGVFLLAAGLVIFLLPFTLAESAPLGWSTGYIIAMLVLGFTLLIVFGVHERFTAKRPFITYRLLTNRSIIGACLLSATYQISYYCWSSYYSSFLQVVTDLSIAQAGYIMNTFDVVSGFLLLLVGVTISKTGRFRWLLYVAIPLYILGQGLMIHFRQPGRGVGYLVMCQIFISVGGSVFILVEQIAVLAAADHQQVASALALLSMVGWIGGAIGNTISGAIWTNTFPQALADLLPASVQSDLEDIYGSLDTQLSYPVGDPIRTAIQEAYGVAQEKMLIAGTAVMALSIASMFLIENYNLAKMQQSKGRLF